ncbi:MAG TPA: type III ribulose-bisphosphate carboxylase [Candidatus Bathyarchaeota archaeon]|nr:type III ribulose-bisphosphate carboxylase [Candidatus Bathyarchaeota archaeon]
MRYIDFVDLDYQPRESDLVCKFRVDPGDHPMEFIAGGVAAESSVGTWTELSTEEPYVRERAAKVFSLEGDRFKVAYPLELFEPGNMPNILSSVAGNVFGLEDLRSLRMEDIWFPGELAESFKGPKYGVEGVRRVTGVEGRPLVGTIIKPKLGLVTRDHAKVAYEAWLGGCDVVKDDENLANQGFNPFEDRLAQTLEARDKAEQETGEKKVYMINVSAETREMMRRAEAVEDQGGRYMMVDILTTGWSSLQTLRDLDLDLVIHAHRAGHAAFTRDPRHGINMVVICKVARLIGVDQLHVGTGVGKMAETRREVEENIGACVGPLHGLKPVLPVASGGLHPGMVPQLVDTFGLDTVIQAGGGIHGHPKGTLAGARAMRQAVDAVIQGVPLEEYAQDHEELRLALERWPSP